MSNPYRKVTVGDPLPRSATLHNGMVDAVLAEKARQLGGGARVLTSLQNAAIIHVKNESGTDLAQFSVLGMDEPIFLPSGGEDAFKREVTFRGVTPVLTDHFGRFVVTLEPCLTGGVARAYAAGVTVVRVDVTDERHDRCDVQDADTGVLLSGYHGTAQILWKEADADGYGGSYTTGEQWAVVRIGAGPPGSIVAKATTSITARSGATYGTGSAKIQGDNGTAYVDDGVTVTVKNTLNKTIASGSYVTCVWANKKWRVVAAGDCANLS